MQADWLSSILPDITEITFLTEAFTSPYNGKVFKYVLYLVTIVGLVAIWILKKNRRLTPPQKEVPNFEDEVGHIPYPYYWLKQSNDDMLNNSESFYKMVSLRRSVRFLSSEPIPKEVIDNLIITAGTSPSGAHAQPWTFAVVSDCDMKLKIRAIIEHEEYLNYKSRMGKKWVDALSALAVNWVKEYLTEAPYLVLLFRHAYDIAADGERKECYYNEISSSISIGILLTAIQNVGLTTVVTTPLNCGSALKKLLARPKNERLVALLPVGHPAPDALIPNLTRKSLHDIMVNY